MDVVNPSVNLNRTVHQDLWGMPFLLSRVHLDNCKSLLPHLGRHQHGVGWREEINIHIIAL